MKELITYLFFIFQFSVYTQSTLQIGSTTVGIDTVFTGIDVPWEIIYGPDNKLWVTERKGIVSHIDPITKTRKVLLDIQNGVYAQDESGLLGMALHPDFLTNNEVFIVYTYGVQPGVKERLVKYKYLNNSLLSPQILLDDIIGTNAHDGSRLLFMPDKTLLMTTGDANVITTPQSTTSLNGKVLRLNADGSVPSDNPFPGSLIYSYGHRNPQGLTRASWGEYYISEHGPSTDDEFQLLEKGRNYGWPDVHGFCDLPAESSFCAANNVKEPIIDWTPTIAPCDMVYYSNNMFPEFNERFLMTTLKSKKLVAIKLNASGTSSVSEVSYLNNMFGRLRDICIGPAQEIYLATNGAADGNSDPYTHSILVLTPPTPTVSISQNVEQKSFHVFPSVSNFELTINNMSGILQDVEIELMDITGRIWSYNKISRGINTINISELNPGFYFIRISDQEKLLHMSRCIKN